MQMSRQIAVLLAVGLMAGCSLTGPAGSPVGTMHQTELMQGRVVGQVEPDPMPIVAWCGPPEPQMVTTERYREIAAAGITDLIERNTNHFEPDFEPGLRNILHHAEQAGLRAWTFCGQDVEDVVRYVGVANEYDSFAGYVIYDEPSADKFPGLAMHMNRIRREDPHHPMMVNLFPNYANSEQTATATYREYVEEYVRQLPITIMSFDHYPVAGFTVRPMFYENLEIFHEVSQEAGLPFWAFALVSAHWSYYPSTLAQLRLQAFANLAYGAQGIQYFPFWAENWDHTDCPVDFGGERGEMYDRVKQLNTEIQALSGVFNGASVVSVGHTTGLATRQRPTSTRPMGNPESSIPMGTSPYEPASPVKWYQATGKEGAAVSHLVNGNRNYLVFVNRDFANLLVLELEFDGTRTVSRILNDGRILELDDQRSFCDQIEPGHLCIISWETDLQ